MGLFGTGSELYFQFAERYLKIFMLLTFANGIQPMSAGFFTSIGKAKLGVIMSLTRQLVFLLPLIVIFPLFMGIDGVMYAGPIADVYKRQNKWTLQEGRQFHPLCENQG